MFQPIIHNLEVGTDLSSLVQQYNLLITKKPTFGNLEQKIAAQRVWKGDCQDLLIRINNAG